MSLTLAFIFFAVDYWFGERQTGLLCFCTFVEELLSPYHKRSLSDASAVLHHYPHTTAPLGLLASSSHQTPVGVKPGGKEGVL